MLGGTGKTIKHYAPCEWADFVRGVSPAGDRDNMQRHLDGGCAECRQMAELLSRVAASAIDDLASGPPAYALHYVRSIYRLQQPEQVRILPRVIARVVYDSFRGPLLAGVRGQRQMTRQVL